jgi:superfamily I DNA/RNA helicase
MRALLDHTPTPEQLPVISDASPGTTLICGAAGSGKTSTAVWRLKFVVNYWRGRVKDGHIDGPVRVLVLTFNRTLRGYISELAKDQVKGDNLHMEVTTFGHWAWEVLGKPEVMNDLNRRRIIEKLAKDFKWQPKFTLDEVSYVLGRYMPEDVERYLTEPRLGRGAPRLNAATKRQVFNEIIAPYVELKERQLPDWQDLAGELARERRVDPYHVIVVDETQDFSANQIRALMNHAADDSTVTFVLDALQKIYPHRFLWSEIPLQIDHRHTLRQNHRNTREVALFCQALLEGLDLPDDGTLPDFESCTRTGPKPLLVPGRFNKQMDVVISALHKNLKRSESNAILHALGGLWFREVQARLKAAGIPFVEIAGEPEWPQGDENVALSTMASAKGLEFDHVFIVGLNAEVTPHGAEEGDDLLEGYRRLLAMAAGRARLTVTIGYKPQEASTLIDYLGDDTYEVVA